MPLVKILETRRRRFAEHHEERRTEDIEVCGGSTVCIWRLYIPRAVVERRRAERAERWKLKTIGQGNGNGNVYIKRVRSWALETPPAPKNEVKSHGAKSVD
jgi:hypothetical protein